MFRPIGLLLTWSKKRVLKYMETSLLLHLSEHHHQAIPLAC